MDLYGIAQALLSVGLLGGGTAIIFQKSKSYLKRNQLRTDEQNQESLEYERLKLLFHHTQKEAKLGIWDWDLNSNTLTWSDEVYHIFDQSKTVTPSVDIIRAMIFAEELADYDNALQAVLDGKYPRRLQYRIETQNHFIKHISEKREVIKDPTGKPIRILGTIQDISKQTQTTKYLFKTKSNYRLLTQTLPVGIYRSNKRGDILFVNQTMVEMFGYSCEEEMMKQKCFDFYEDSSTRGALLTELDTEGMVIDHKIRFRRKDGSVFIGTENAQIEGDELHGVIQDVTMRNAIEEEKNDLIFTLQKQNEDLERFAHIISHNLRIPLVNLVGLTQIMDVEGLSQDNKEILDLMKQSTNNLDMIIKDLNKTVSIRNKRHEHYELIDLHKCLNTVKEDLKEKIAENNATIKSNIGKKDKVLSIPGFMVNILTQLIDNSIKFKHPDRNPSIEIDYQTTAKNHVLLIADNGIGIDMTINKERLFKLYEKFYPSMEGRGVGLYMAYNQINALKGDIQIESEVNKGTIVKISIPRENQN